jgi:hypothetical protein
MNISEQEVSKLRGMLESYKQQQGTIAMGSPESTNMSSCTSCTARCAFTCTDSCTTYCDGNSGYCWAHWHGN